MSAWRHRAGARNGDPAWHEGLDKSSDLVPGRLVVDKVIPVFLEDEIAIAPFTFLSSDR